MSGSTITTLTAALDGCAAVDLAALSGPQLGAMLIDLRATATRLEVEIARVVHAASRAEVWRAAGATSMEVWLAGAAYADETGRPHHTRIADALTALATAYNAGEISGGRERPKLLVTVPFETILERATTRGVIIASGATISGEAARRLACDADLHRVITKGTSVILDFGTTTRLATDNQYLALALRDGGCRWPGCDRPPGWCQAHHIDEVIRDDGPTDLINLALLCSCHHHYAHAPDWTLIGNAIDLHIRTPNGTLMPAPPNGHITGPQQPTLQLTC